MTDLEAIRKRHSVRRFTGKPLNPEAAAALREEADACNRESGLHIQLLTDEPDAFQAGKPEYGAIKRCRDYFDVIGPKGMEEAAGYYGERLVLKAIELGIQSCWVALTYKKGQAKGTVLPGEKRYLVIALGYGETEGAARKSKSVSDVSDWREGDPDWYRNGIEAALLAPTAVNQQKFRFELDRENGLVTARAAGIGFHTKLDLGIVKYHFEIGSGKPMAPKGGDDR